MPWNPDSLTHPRRMFQQMSRGWPLHEATSHFGVSFRTSDELRKVLLSIWICVLLEGSKVQEKEEMVFCVWCPSQTNKQLPSKKEDTRSVNQSEHWPPGCSVELGNSAKVPQVANNGVRRIDSTGCTREKPSSPSKCLLFPT